jgi:uncharacterized membrane protein ArfC
MDHVNWWLIGLAFVLGLLLTFALTIRRVKREVPASSSTGAAAARDTTGDAAESGATNIETAKTSTAEEVVTTKTPTVGEAPTTKTAAAGVGAAESKTEESESESENNEDARGD